jgi:hypothetical protein
LRAERFVSTEILATVYLDESGGAKMRKVLELLVLVACIISITGTSFAQTVDIVKFMGLKAGKWGQEQSQENYICGDPQSSMGGWKVVKGPDGTLLVARGNHGGIFKVQATSVSSIGEWEGDDIWLLNPPMTLARYLKINKPYAYKGIAVNQTTKESIPVSQMLIISEKNVTVTTAAGTFTNCIKWESHGGQHHRVSFYCLNRGEVKFYDWEAVKTTNPEDPISSSLYRSDIVSYGDSNAPF